MISCILLLFRMKHRRASGLLSLLDWHGNQHALSSSSHHPGNFCLWDPESAKIFFVESGIQGIGIRNTAKGIRNSTKDWNLESKFNCQRLESSTWNPEFAALESRIQDCLGFPFTKRPIFYEQKVVTLRVCASRWTEVCGGIGSQRMKQRKMAPLSIITIVLVICSLFVECR